MKSQEASSLPGNTGVLRGHEFEALKCRFENQVEQLHRMTLIDIRVFSGYITLQLGFGAWIATQGTVLASVTSRVGLMIIDSVLAAIAGKLIYNSYRRRKEVAGVVRNCCVALGFKTVGVYLDGATLDVPTRFYPWVRWYILGIVAALAGVALVLFGKAA